MGATINNELTPNIIHWDAYTVKPVETHVKRPLKKDKTKIFMTNGNLMKVESTAECILSYF